MRPLSTLPGLMISQCSKSVSCMGGATDLELNAGDRQSLIRSGHREGIE
jgi:hypothetical protein